MYLPCSSQQRQDAALVEREKDFFVELAFRFAMAKILMRFSKIRIGFVPPVSLRFHFSFFSKFFTGRGFCNCSICRVKKGWAPTGIMGPEVIARGYNSVAHYLVQTYQEESNKQDVINNNNNKNNNNNHNMKNETNEDGNETETNNSESDKSDIEPHTTRSESPTNNESHSEVKSEIQIMPVVDLEISKESSKISPSPTTHKKTPTSHDFSLRVKRTSAKNKSPVSPAQQKRKISPVKKVVSKTQPKKRGRKRKVEKEEEDEDIKVENEDSTSSSSSSSDSLEILETLPGELIACRPAPGFPEPFWVGRVVKSTPQISPPTKKKSIWVQWFEIEDPEGELQENGKKYFKLKESPFIDWILASSVYHKGFPMNYLEREDLFQVEEDLSIYDVEQD
jgi:hypothetical protein